MSETNINTRGHNFKIKTKYSRVDMRKYSFAVRVVELWNKLSYDTVNSESLNVFKNRLDNDMNKLIQLNKLDYDQFL